MGTGSNKNGDIAELTFLRRPGDLYYPACLSFVIAADEWIDRDGGIKNLIMNRLGSAKWYCPSNDVFLRRQNAGK